MFGVITDFDYGNLETQRSSGALKWNELKQSDRQEMENGSARRIL
jgi:hypothetical protein